MPEPEQQLLQMMAAGGTPGTPLSGMDTDLAALPDGAKIAVVTLLGSLCPVTLGHVQCFIEARALFLSGANPAGRYGYCVGFISLNSDGHLRSKFAGKDEKPLTMRDRKTLVELAAADVPWLHYSAHHPRRKVNELSNKFPTLAFERFDMNGADDVVKYQKWRYVTGPKVKTRLLTMQRPGSTAALLQGMRAVGIPKHGSANFVLGPELPDISSTKARAASRAGDRAELLELLHPAVADWMLAHDGHSIASVDNVLASALPSSSSLQRLGSGTNGSHTQSVVDASSVGTANALADVDEADLATVRRTDSQTGTLLRATPLTKTDAFVEPLTQVLDGEAVEVLRPPEPELNGGSAKFVWVRSSCGAEGFLNASYLLPPTPLKRVVRRTDGGSSTMLRAVPTRSRDPAVMVASRACVQNGEAVEVLQRAPDSEFAWIRSSCGAEGFLNASYLLPLTPLAMEVRRTDGGSSTMLRAVPIRSRDPAVMVASRACVQNGEAVEVLGSVDHEFVWVRSAGGFEGFLNSSYLVHGK
eukprot:SAG31_NODE_653_length_13152_cov_4.899487_4_plen_529_part_00